MSKLEQLIAEICPDGVEYKSLGEIGNFYGGISGKSKGDFSDGNAKFITYMNIFSNIALNIDVVDKVKISKNENQHTIQYGDVLFTGSSEIPNECGMSSVLTLQTNEKLYLNSFCFGFRLDNKDMLLPSFSKYLFRSDELRKQISRTASGVTRFNVSKKKMERVTIPLPPLPVQEEIVRILDNFTELTIELKAELVNRKKQYEYYRDSLLTFGDDVEYKPLGFVEINTILAYEQPTKYIVRETNYDDSFKTPVLTAGQSFILGYTNETNDIYQADKENPVIIFDDFTTSFHWVDFNFKIKSSAIKILKIKPDKVDDVSFRYTYYYMKSIKYAIVDHSRQWIMKYSKFKIPIPSLAEQQRIVDILDRFDTLCNDIREGLPAEIKARQQQYEYYRDKLLTFDKLEVVE